MYQEELAEDEHDRATKKRKTDKGPRPITDRRIVRSKKKFIKFEKKMARKARGNALVSYRPDVEKFDPVFG